MIIPRTSPSSVVSRNAASALKASSGGALVSPGNTEDGFSAPWLPPVPRHAAWVRDPDIQGWLHSPSRILLPEDVAEAVVWVCSRPRTWTSPG